ncbi:hypothetical protein BGW80DRAFT_1255065 [Lactifluus volemus]|nr:hypothetical protein BGW80DRAFT_1255065 [Lactifluus volemus]
MFRMTPSRFPRLGLGVRRCDADLPPIQSAHSNRLLGVSNVILVPNGVIPDYRYTSSGRLRGIAWTKAQFYRDADSIEGQHILDSRASGISDLGSRGDAAEAMLLLDEACTNESQQNDPRRASEVKKPEREETRLQYAFAVVEYFHVYCDHAMVIINSSHGELLRKSKDDSVNITCITWGAREPEIHLKFYGCRDDAINIEDEVCS